MTTTILVRTEVIYFIPNSETKSTKHVEIFHLSKNATNKQEKSYDDYSCAYNEKTLYCWFVAISNE